MEEDVKKLVDDLIDTRIEAEDLVEKLETALEDIKEVELEEEE